MAGNPTKVRSHVAVTMNRQISSVLGVSVLVALLGTPVGYDEAYRAFQGGWAACALVSLLAVIPALGMTPRRTPVPTAAPMAMGVAS